MPSPLVDRIIDLILAVVFGWAAVQKARTSNAVVIEFARVVGGLAAVMTRVVILTEILLVIALVAAPTPIPSRALAGVFLLLASAYIAVRLAILPGTSCQCWGAEEPREYERDGERQSEVEQNLVRDVLRPVWFSARNGALLALAWVAIAPCQPVCDLGIDWAIGAAPAAMISLGLAAAVVRARGLIGAEVHPLRRFLEPRLRPLVAFSWYSSSFAPIRGGTHTKETGLTALGSPIVPLP